MNVSRPSPAGLPRQQRGLSILELMIGLAVGMLLIAGLAVMFGNASRSSVELDKTMRHIENGRHAMDVLGEDLAMAGFYGTVPVSAYTAGLPPCANGAQVASDLATKASAAPPSLPFALEGIYPAQTTDLTCLEYRKAGTPAIVIRRLEAAELVPAATLGDVAYVQTSHFSPDNFYSYKAAIGTGKVAFDLRNIKGDPNPVRKFITRAYYIASCGNCNNAGDGISTLKRVEIIGQTRVVTPIAEGVDQIGLDYGFDTSNDGVADEWYGLNGTAGAAQAAIAAGKNWANVVAVRISLVSRNTEATPGYTDTRRYSSGLDGDTPVPSNPSNDAFKRRAYVTTVKLQSIAGLRELP